MDQPEPQTPTCAGCVGCGGPDCIERPAPRPDLRQRIADVIHGADGTFTHTDADILTDAVLAVRDDEMEALRERLRKAERAVDLLAGSHRRAEAAEARIVEAQVVASRLRAYLAGFADVLDPSDQTPWGNTVGTALADLDKALAGPSETA